MSKPTKRSSRTPSAVVPEGGETHQTTTSGDSTLTIPVPQLLPGNTLEYTLTREQLSTVKEFAGNRAHPGKDRTEGYFGFAGHSDPVQFRNIQIREIR